MSRLQRHRRVPLVPEQEAALLKTVEDWRRQCIVIMRKAPINRPLYLSMLGMVEAIDGVAEALTGDRRLFHLKASRTPGPTLPGYEPPKEKG